MSFINQLDYATPSKDSEDQSAGSPHTGINVFQLNNAQRYFTKETILREELGDDLDLEFYLEDKNIVFALERIFGRQFTEQPEQDVHGCSQVTPSKCKGSQSSNINKSQYGTANNLHKQLIQRMRLNLSLPDSDTDSSICMSQSGSPVKGAAARLLKQDQEHEEQSKLEEHVKVDLVALFWLMSVLPPTEASCCKETLDQDQFVWKISLYDVLMVLLNWGASLESLCMDEVFDPSHTQVFSPRLPSLFSSETTKGDIFPTPTNVRLVLTSIAERVPVDGQEADWRRTLLLQSLVFASMDVLQRCNMLHYRSSVQSLLDSYPSWDDIKAQRIAEALRLSRMGEKNSVFVCCSLFNLTSVRLDTLGLYACHDVLQCLFGLASETDFLSIVHQLVFPPELFNRLQMWQVYQMTQLVHSLLVRHTDRTPPCPQEAVALLQEWTIQVRDSLKKHPYMYNLESGYLRERLSRLSSECASVVRSVYSDENRKMYNFSQLSLEESPCK